MLKIVTISLLQSLLLALGQVFLKLAIERAEAFAFRWEVIRSYLTNWYFALVGLLFGAATVLWFHILRNYPFSVAYPLTSFAYVFGVLAAWAVFKEPIPWIRWMGVLLIMAGVFLLTKK